MAAYLRIDRPAHQKAGLDCVIENHGFTRLTVRQEWQFFGVLPGITGPRLSVSTDFIAAELVELVAAWRPRSCLTAV